MDDAQVLTCLPLLPSRNCASSQAYDMTPTRTPRLGIQLCRTAVVLDCWCGAANQNQRRREPRRGQPILPRNFHPPGARAGTAVPLTQPGAAGPRGGSSLVRDVGRGGVRETRTAGQASVLGFFGATCSVTDVNGCAPGVEGSGFTYHSDCF